jgi:hypothetical protein
LDDQIADRQNAITGIQEQITNHQLAIAERQTMIENLRAQDEAVPLRREVADLKHSVAQLQELVTQKRHAAGKQSLEELRGEVNKIWTHLDAKRGVYARLDSLQAAWKRDVEVLHGGVARLEAERANFLTQVLDAAREEAAQIVDSVVAPIREGQKALDDSWRNLRAERVRADDELVRETDAAHHQLADELASLGTQKARTLTTGVVPRDPAAAADLAQFRARCVRRVLEACLLHPVVDEQGVRTGLYDYAAADPQPAEQGRLRRFVDAATRLRAKIGEMGRQPEFDFELPAEETECKFWHPCDESAPPTFVVVPAYRVAGHTFGLPVVFTASPPAGEAALPPPRGGQLAGKRVSGGGSGPGVVHAADSGSGEADPADGSAAIPAPGGSGRTGRSGSIDVTVG